MSFLDDMLDIVEPGYHAPQAPRSVDDAPLRPRATAVASVPYEFRKRDFIPVDATIDERGGIMCAVCGVREARGAAGVCARRLCREVVETSE